MKTKNVPYGKISLLKMGNMVRFPFQIPFSCILQKKKAYCVIFYDSLKKFDLKCWPFLRLLMYLCTYVYFK